MEGNWNSDSIIQLPTHVKVFAASAKQSHSYDSVRFSSLSSITIRTKMIISEVIVQFDLL